MSDESILWRRKRRRSPKLTAAISSAIADIQIDTRAPTDTRTEKEMGRRNGSGGCRRTDCEPVYCHSD